MPVMAEFVSVEVTLAGAQPDKFSFATLLGAFSHAVTANRQDGPYPDLASVVAAGFTSVATPEIHAWASAVFAQETGVDQILIGRKDAGDASWTATLDAIELEDPEAFYFLNIQSRVEADVLLAAAWTETRTKVYVAQSADADILDGTSGAVSLLLQAAGYNRTALIYHQFSDANDGAVPSDGYLDGAWSSRCGGFNLDAPNGVGNWKYKQLSGVTADPLTTPEATEIWDADANLYGALKGLSFTSNGTMASGRAIDITTSLDWLKIRTEEAILAAFVGAPTKIPFTAAGINLLKTVVQAVLDQGTSFGHLTPDSPPQWTVPKITEVSDADKIARTLTMSCVVKLTGAIEKLVMNFTVEQ